jgi:hypothetical protein
MDPLAALLYIVRNYSDADVELAERIGAYQEWRAHGGFEPLWVGTEHETTIDQYVREQRLTTYENADAIVEHAARELRNVLRERTGRDFGRNYNARTLDAISDALDAA